MRTKELKKALCAHRWYRKSAIAVISAMALVAVADPISPEQAMQIASQVVNKTDASRLNNQGMTRTLRLTKTETIGQTEAIAYYAFQADDNGGWVIVSGDNRAEAILGYSNQGRLDWQALPPNMVAWLAEYKQQIAWLQAHPDVETASTTQSLTVAADGSIGPLMTTTWGQEMPYYLQCPLYNGEYCVTGCVATAMAQVMNYYQYPTSKTPTLSSYTTSSDRISVPTLQGTVFDWANMLDSYCYWDTVAGELVQTTYTEAQSAAVAELMRHCGQAVKMDYDPEGSGAYVYNQASAMKNFGYSNTTMVSRSYRYTTTQWKNLLDTELNACRPVLYSASCSEGGHAFVIDGRDANGYYHVNWGWYGHGDGFFAIDAMVVKHRNGETLNFNSSHQMLTNVSPDDDYCVLRADSITADPVLTWLGATVNVQAHGVFINSSTETINLVLALADEQGNIIAQSEPQAITQSDYVQYSDISTTITLPDDMAAGDYVLNVYAIDNDQQLNEARSAGLAECTVAHVAKFGAPYDIEDVTSIIKVILGEGGTPVWDVEDTTAVIAKILSNN